MYIYLYVHIYIRFSDYMLHICTKVISDTYMYLHIHVANG